MLLNQWIREPRDKSRGLSSNLIDSPSPVRPYCSHSLLLYFTCSDESIIGGEESPLCWYAIEKSLLYQNRPLISLYEAGLRFLADTLMDPIANRYPREEVTAVYLHIIDGKTMEPSYKVYFKWDPLPVTETVIFELTQPTADSEWRVTLSLMNKEFLNK